MYFNHKCLGTTTPRCNDISSAMSSQRSIMNAWSQALPNAAELCWQLVDHGGITHWWPNFWNGEWFLLKCSNSQCSAIPCFTWSLLFSTSIMSNSLWPPRTTACPASLSFAVSRSLFKLKSAESRMPSNRLILSVAHFSSWLLYCWNSEYILKNDAVKCFCAYRYKLLLAWGFISGKRFFSPACKSGVKLRGCRFARGAPFHH